MTVLKTARIMLRPYPEEPRAASRRMQPHRSFYIHPSRRGQEAAPQDEVSLLFDGDLNPVIFARRTVW